MVTRPPPPLPAVPFPGPQDAARGRETGGRCRVATGQGPSIDQRQSGAGGDQPPWAGRPRRPRGSRRQRSGLCPPLSPLDGCADERRGGRRGPCKRNGGRANAHCGCDARWRAAFERRRPARGGEHGASLSSRGDWEGGETPPAIIACPSAPPSPPADTLSTRSRKNSRPWPLAAHRLGRI